MSSEMKKFLEILDRLTVVTEKWIERRYPKSEEVDPGEVGIYDSGNPEEPKSKEEYEAFNSPKPGRFETAFADHHPED